MVERAMLIGTRRGFRGVSTWKDIKVEIGALPDAEADVTIDIEMSNHAVRASSRYRNLVF